MEQHVGVAVPDSAAIVGKVDPPQAQHFPRLQPVRIVPNADAKTTLGHARGLYRMGDFGTMRRNSTA
jgi:hypothetical protein